MLAMVGAAYGQLPVSIGVKAGGVWNELTVGSLQSRIFPLKAGPYVEVSLPFLPTIETGLMFERFTALGEAHAVYQVPVLVKKRFNAVAVKPFLAGGATIRIVPGRSEKSGGATVAAGVTIGLLPVKIEPEFRYTRWVGTTSVPRAGQVEFLVGLRF